MVDAIYWLTPGRHTLPMDTTINCMWLRVKQECGTALVTIDTTRAIALVAIGPAPQINLRTQIWNDKADTNYQVLSTVITVRTALC